MNGIHTKPCWYSLLWSNLTPCVSSWATCATVCYPICYPMQLVISVSPCMPACFVLFRVYLRVLRLSINILLSYLDCPGVDFGVLDFNLADLPSCVRLLACCRRLTVHSYLIIHDDYASYSLW